MERRELSCELIGEDDPKLVLDELGHFFSQEVGVLGSRSVAPSLDAGVELVQGPWRRRGHGGHTFISPGSE